MKIKDTLEIGDKVEFISGNYEGLTGIVTEVKYDVLGTPYGLRYTVKLRNGELGYIEKSEHFQILNHKYVIELSDGELQIVTEKQLDEMYDNAMEFDGFLGFMVKGRLV